MITKRFLTELRNGNIFQGNEESINEQPSFDDFMEKLKEAKILGSKLKAKEEADGFTYVHSIGFGQNFILNVTVERSGNFQTTASLVVDRRNFSISAGEMLLINARETSDSLTKSIQNTLKRFNDIRKRFNKDVDKEIQQVTRKL